jgi:hypothetical protein
MCLLEAQMSFAGLSPNASMGRSRFAGADFDPGAMRL